MFEDAKLYGVEKAKSAEQIMFKRSTFVDYPNLWTSNLNFANQTQVSDANPQQKNINWGSVELVDWTSGDGEKLQGLLYKPEDFDPNKNTQCWCIFTKELPIVYTITMCHNQTGLSLIQVIV